MINIKLLSEVLGCKIDYILIENTSLNPSGENIVYKTGKRVKVIDVYKLSHKCKEWALQKNYILSSYIYDKGAVCWLIDDKTGSEEKSFYFTTEQEAIIKACEWLYNKIYTSKENK